MKPFLIKGFTLVLLLVVIAKGYGQDNKSECNKCGQRIVVCRDFDILTASPVTAEDSISWKQLHYASDAYVRSMMGKESPECLAFLPCRIGDDAPPWEKPCPYRGESTGDNFNSDYELFGEIRGNEGAYVLTLKLVTVKRELIASKTKRFEKASESEWYGQLAALDLGSTESGSRKLYDVIHEFEVKKRDEAQGIRYNQTALNAVANFMQDTYKVKIKGSLSVDIQLKDCDEEPLKSAKLVLQVNKGHFENAEVETDDQGIAHAVYIAPDKEGTTDVKVEYNFRYPSDKLGFASGFTTIDIYNEREVKFTETQYVAEVASSIPVQVLLKGCSPEELTAAVLELTAEKGKFKTNTLKPDSKGVARAVYLAPVEVDKDRIRVVYRYTTPDGPHEITDSREVEVVRPGLWLIRAKVTETTSWHRDTVDTVILGDKKWIKESRSEGKKEVIGEVTAVVENMAVDPDRDFSYSSDPGVPVSLNASWTGSYANSDDYKETIGGTLIQENHSKGQASGHASDICGIEFEYSADYKSVSAGIGILAEYQHKDRRYRDEWTEYEGKYPYTINCSIGCDETGGRVCNINKVGAGYQVNLIFNEDEKKSSLAGTEYIRSNRTLELTVTPLKSAAK